MTVFKVSSLYLRINPFMPVAAKTASQFFGDISLIKVVYRKYLKENCSSEPYPQLSVKYFANVCLIPKLFLKVSQVQMTLVK